MKYRTKEYIDFALMILGIPILGFLALCFLAIVVVVWLAYILVVFPVVIIVCAIRGEPVKVTLKKIGKAAGK